MKELAPPPTAPDDPNSVELVRGWVVNNGLQCSLNIGGFGDDELVIWGVLLSAMARHVATALDERGVGDAAENLKTIATQFIHEINTPTAETSGSFTE